MNRLSSIFLPRSIVESDDIVSHPIRLTLFLALVKAANLSSSFIDWVKGPRQIKRGQVHTSLSELSEKLDSHRETITKHLCYLEFRKFIAVDRSTRFGLVATVLNFDDYIIVVERIDALSPTNEPTNEPTNAPTNAPTNGCDAMPSSSPTPPLKALGEKGNTTTAREKPLLKQVQECWGVYCESLTSIGIPPKKLNPINESNIARAINYASFEDVKDALEGVRYETKSGDFDPKNHISLDYCLNRNSKTGKSNLERLGNMARMKRLKSSRILSEDEQARIAQGGHA